MEKNTVPFSSRRRRQERSLPLLPAGILLVACLSLFCLGVGGAFKPSQKADGPPTEPWNDSTMPESHAPVEPEPEPQPVVTTVTFSASGDNLIHSPIYKQAERWAAEGERYNFDACYEHMKGFYARFDVNWINQETLCSRELEPSTYPCFSTPGECAEALYRAGIRVYSLANNHTYDKGSKGIAATLRFWDSMPEDVVTTGLWYGESDYGTIPMQTVNGVTIAYLSYTEHTNGIPRNSSMSANILYTHQTDVIEQQVRTAAELADFVVVGTHWGTEDSHTINDGQRTLAQQLADWGADVIVGTHPHVLQDAAWLTAEDGRQVFVAYSLGNFLSTQSKPDQLIGAVLSLTLEKTTEPDGTVHCAVRSPKLHPVVTHYEAGKAGARVYLYQDYTPELAQKHGARAKYSSFSKDALGEVARQNVSEDFLEFS